LVLTLWVLSQPGYLQSLVRTASSATRSGMDLFVSARLGRHPAGTVADGALAIIFAVPGPAAGPGTPMTEPLALGIYCPDADGAFNIDEPLDTFGPLSPGEAIDELARHM
jgi:hypothetical protein